MGRGKVRDRAYEKYGFGEGMESGKIGDPHDESPVKFPHGLVFYCAFIL